MINSKEKLYDAAEIEAIASEMLIQAGLSPHLIGFVYMKNAISLVISEPKLQHSTMLLYKKIAELHGVDYKSVERAVRYMIEAAYTTNDKALKEFLGYSSNLPRNSEMLSLLAEKVRNKIRLG